MDTFVEFAASHTLYTWVKLWLRWKIEFLTWVVTSKLGGSNGFRGSNGSSGWNWNLKGSNDFKGSNALQWLALGIWKKIKDWVSDMCGDKSMVVGCKTNKSQSCASLPARSDIGINRPTTTTTGKNNHNRNNEPPRLIWYRHQPPHNNNNRKKQPQQE